MSTPLVAQSVNNLPIMWETQVWFLGQEDPLEKRMVTHSRILAWKTPRTEEPGGLQSMGSQRVGHDCVTNTHTSVQRAQAGKDHCPQLPDEETSLWGFCGQPASRVESWGAESWTWAFLTQNALLCVSQHFAPTYPQTALLDLNRAELYSISAVFMDSVGTLRSPGSGCCWSVWVLICNLSRMFETSELCNMGSIRTGIHFCLLFCSLEYVLAFPFLLF